MHKRSFLKLAGIPALFPSATLSDPFAAQGSSVAIVRGVGHGRVTGNAFGEIGPKRMKIVRV